MKILAYAVSGIVALALVVYAPCGAGSLHRCSGAGLSCPGCAEVSMLHAVGLTLVPALAGWTAKPQPDKPEDKMVCPAVPRYACWLATITPGLALAVGWVVRGAM